MSTPPDNFSQETVPGIDSNFELTLLIDTIRQTITIHIHQVEDDEEAGGFLFSYEKLLGAKAPSQRDVQNSENGKENTIDRTMRLFYVTCSRAEKSLAVVIYSKDPSKVKEHAISQGWFDKDELIYIE